MLKSRIRSGVRAGITAAAATGGAVIGYGARHNDWPGPFVTLGHQVLRGFGMAGAPRFLVTTAGMAAHVSWMVLWGIAFSPLAHRRTPAVTVLDALLTVLGAALVARSFMPAAMGAVTFSGMPAIQVALSLALMVAGLLLGGAVSRAE